MISFTGISCYNQGESRRQTREATVKVSQNRFRGGFERVDHAILRAINGDGREER